jgi:hypothetical protein
MKNRGPAAAGLSYKQSRIEVMMRTKKFLIVLCCLPLLISSLYGEIVVNELLFDPDGTDTDLEWVELMNDGAQSINLRDYLLDVDGPNFMLPEYILPPGEILTVHTNYSGTPHVEDGHMYLYNTDHNMGNSHGFVGLWRPNDFGQIADFFVSYVEYGAPGQTWESQAVTAEIWYDDEFVPDVAAGHSIHWDGLGLGAAFWYDDPEPVGGESETVTEVMMGSSDTIMNRENIRLLPNYPNPFNASTRIRFQLMETSSVNLTIHNTLGQTVRSLLNGSHLNPGQHSVDLALGGLPGGTYFCCVTVAGDSKVQPICYLK